MSNKKSLGLALVALGFVLLALTGIRTISNPDIFTHIALGQAHSVKADPLSYTMPGAQWINMNPLYNSLVYLLWKLGGAGLVTLAHVLVVLVSFAMMLNFGKKWGGPLSQGLALLLCAQLMFPVFNPGPSAFFMLFTATFLTLLYRVKNFNLLAVLLLILQVLWTNMHPSFVFGPALILFFAFENWQETQKTSRSMSTPLATKLFGLAAAALLVTLINPNLVNLHRHIFANWVLMTGKENLEWVSLFSGSFPQGIVSSLTIFTLILGAGGLITLQKRLPAMLTALALVGAFLTVRSVGTLHLFAFLAFPFMILSFTAISGYLTRATPTASSKISATTQYNLLAAVALGLMILSTGSLITNHAYIRIGSASQFGLGVQKDAFPVAAANILSRTDFPTKILNIAHDGGYIALQNPSCKVSCDTRTSFYGNEFYQTLNRALLGQPGAWNKIRSEWSPHAVVLNGCWPDAGALAKRLLASRAWKLVYFDGSTIIMVADLPEYATLINNPEIQQAGLKVLEKARRDYLEQSKGLVKAGNSSRLIGAGNIYYELNRLLEAEAVYTALTDNSPNMAGAWLGLGQTMILQKQISKGLEYMEKAAKITPRNARVWLSLLQAYRLKGDAAKANIAAEQLNKFYKAEKATVEEQDAAKEQKKPIRKPEQQTGSTMELPANLKK